jgi:hypothetical protein
MKDDSKNTLDKQLYCVDYNSDGTKLVVCGSEPVVQCSIELDSCVGCSQES